MRKTLRTRTPHSSTVACAGNVIPYTLIWSAARRRSIGYRVEPRGVVLRAPLRISVASVEALIREKAGWIIRHLKDLADRPVDPVFGDGSPVWLLGRPFTLAVTVEQGLKRQKCVVDEAILRVYVAKPEPEVVEKVLRRWVEAEAKPVLLQRVADIAAVMGLRAGKIELSHAKRRWGSCSHRNDLRFSWRLLMAPLPLVDYVIVHELAHVVHKNHSARFWRLVERYDPDYRVKRKELNTFGRKLA